MLRPRILFVNRSYWPDVEATGQLLTELCEDLAGDFDVHVLCGQPQKAAVGIELARGSSGNRNGVTIHRVRHTRFDKASFFGRLANMLTFQAACCGKAFSVPRPDVVVTETDPPLLCLLGGLLQRLRRARLVCYLQDIYPDVAVALGKMKPGLITRGLRRAFFAVYRTSDAVIVLSEDMRRLIADGGVPAARLHVLRNWVDTAAIYPVKQDNGFRFEHGLADKFVVMYSGNLGLSQRLEQVLEAAEQLRQRDDMVFALVGDGADRRRLERLAAEKDLRNVRFFDYQAKLRLAESLSAADVHLVALRPEVKQLLMPSKLYGVLASGTPAIVLAEADCELARTVVEHDLGCVVASEDPAALAAAISAACKSRAALARQGAGARAFAEANCGRGASVVAMRELLAKLAARPAVVPLSAEPQVAASRPAL
ncbi:MAG: glycosyltransferase family 4 protein [Pirellulales bacterium]|nr:glycosyltransferase family 4 protein [Pirellulales bacterium]